MATPPEMPHLGPSAAYTRRENVPRLGGAEKVTEPEPVVEVRTTENSGVVRNWLSIRGVAEGEADVSGEFVELPGDPVLLVVSEAQHKSYRI